MKVSLGQLPSLKEVPQPVPHKDGDDKDKPEGRPPKRKVYVDTPGKRSVRSKAARKGAKVAVEAGAKVGAAVIASPALLVGFNLLLMFNILVSLYRALNTSSSVETARGLSYGMAYFLYGKGDAPPDVSWLPDEDAKAFRQGFAKGYAKAKANHIKVPKKSTSDDRKTLTAATSPHVAINTIYRGLCKELFSGGPLAVALGANTSWDTPACTNYDKTTCPSDEKK